MTPIPPGYRKKPIGVYLVALGLMASGILSALYGLRVGGFDPSNSLTWARAGAAMPKFSWFFCAMVFIAGATLLSVRRWSWQFAVITLGAVAIYDLSWLGHISQSARLTLGGMVLGTVVVVVFLCADAFRRPYLNPKVRWWETSERFRADLPVTVGQAAAVLIDISRTGVLVSGTLPDLADETSLILPGDIQINCRVIRRTENGYGLQFENLDAERKRKIKQLLRTLSNDPTRVAR